MRQNCVCVRTQPKVKAAWINRASGQQAKSPGLQGSAGASAKALETPFPERSVPVPWKCGAGLTYLSTEARMEGSEGFYFQERNFEPGAIGGAAAGASLP